jgi:hypothetical protein
MTDEEYALSEGWTTEKLWFGNINGSSEQATVWFPPDCSLEERDGIIEDVADCISMNMWHKTTHLDAPYLERPRVLTLWNPEGNEDELEISLDGHHIASLNHDEDGYAGMESVASAVTTMARILKLEVENK